LVFIVKLVVRSTCFGHHYAHHQGLYRWLLLVVHGALVYRSLVSVELWVYVSGLWNIARDAHHQEVKSYTDGCCLWYMALWFTGRW